MVDCEAPAGLSAAERKFWDYYAAQLKAERRLTLKARDVLATYCTARAVIAQLRRALTSKKKADIAQRAANRKELRQWALAARLYENDLVLNISSSIRAPRATGDEDDDTLPPAPPGAPVDPFSEFDEPESVN